ncbi:MAG: protein kinase [Myxococcota bacterium]|nr:protein kinase [Myxococcota bacterium]MDW8362524.1 protein kinase [Myxococcales bacterium]
MIRKVGRYELLEEIGHGGMATVYRARDSRLDRAVAVKILHPHLRGAHEARVRFDREARSVARLRHPHIVEIYDNSDENSEEGYIVTELLTGPTLRAFAEAHPDMPVEVAACLGIAIARALGAAHRAGIVHRDVKPENVLLHEARDIKLTDFGIAQMLDAQSFTVTGQILGSPAHMAPEQVEGGPCDARTDVFALGTLLYFLATGRLPFTGRNPHQVLRRVVEGDYPDPLRLRPAMGTRFRAILTRCLARNPDERFASMADLERALLEFLAHSGVDDPDALRVRYLGDPQGTTRELVPRVVETLIGRGKQAAAAGRLEEALDDWNRALALDEGNTRVLGLVERLHRQHRHRRLAVGLVTAAGSLSLAVAAWASMRTDPDATATDARDAARATTQLAPDASAITASADATTRDVARVARTTTDASSNEPVRQRTASRETSGGEQRGADPSSSPRASAERALVANPDRAAPRRVVFDPWPTDDVQVSIDGGPLRPYGSETRAVDLVPGRHHIRAVTSQDCCEEWSAEVEVPPGDEPLRLRIPLPLRPAAIIVRTRAGTEDGPNVFGDVLVGSSRGRTHDPLLVPVDAVSTRLPFRVTAPGYLEHDGVLEARAGRTTTLIVVLEPRPTQG